MKIVAKPFTVWAMAENRHDGDGDEVALTNTSTPVAIIAMANTLPFPPHVFVCLSSLFGSGNCGYNIGISLYSIRI